MASPDIIRFVELSLSEGLPKSKIAQALKSGGWTEQEIQAALQTFSDVKFPIPVPRKKASSSPREAFFHLTMFTALYIWASFFGALLFQFVNLALPLPSETPNDFFGEIRWATAAIVAAFPTFLFMQKIISKELAENPGLGISPVRRWLTYLTLFVAVVVLLTDLIFLVLRLLEGEITSRFVLKAVIVGSLAGGVVFHYLRELRKWEEKLSSMPFFPESLLKKVLVGLIGISVAGAVYVTGGPVKARYLAQDEQRVKDLRNIYYKVDQFYRAEGRLPNTLEECNTSPDVFIRNKRDAITGKPYGYKVVDNRTFELSGNFNLPSPKRERGPENRSYYVDYDESFWTHPAGNHSFTIQLKTTKKN